MIISQIIEGVYAKNLKAMLLFVYFSKAFDSIHRVKIELLHPKYGFPKETFTVIMMLYKSMKAMVHSPDGDSDFFNIVAV